MPTYHAIHTALVSSSEFRYLEIAKDHVDDPQSMVWVPREDGSFLSTPVDGEQAMIAREVAGGILRFSLSTTDHNPLMVGATVGGLAGGILFRSRLATLVGAGVGAVLAVVAERKRVMSFRMVRGKWRLCDGGVYGPVKVLRSKVRALSE